MPDTDIKRQQPVTRWVGLLALHRRGRG